MFARGGERQLPCNTWHTADLMFCSKHASRWNSWMMMMMMMMMMIGSGKVQKCLHILYRTITCNIFIFCLNLVVMVTRFVPLKIQVTYFHLLTLNTLLFTGKISRLLAHWNQCSFGWFLPKFGCYGNCLGSLKTSHCILEFANPKTLPYTQKVFPYLVQN